MSLPCPELPKLSASKRVATDNAGCSGGNEKTEVNCSEVLIKFGEVEIEQEIEMKFITNYFALGKKGINAGRPRLRAVNIGSPSFNFKYDEPKYLAGALVQLHDYYAYPEGNSIIDFPATDTKKITYEKSGKKDDIKLFKLTPWEYFGCTNLEAVKAGWDFGNEDYNDNVDWLGDPINDLSYNPQDLVYESSSLRGAYIYEANELLKKLKKKETSFKNYFSAKAIKFVDYTNEMQLLYSLAATGQLPYDNVQKKYRIGDDENEPGYQRKIKLVFNLYFKAVRAEMGSVCGVVLSEVKLNNLPAGQALNRPRKECLKVLIVINNQDTEENREGVYHFGICWSKSNPAQSFLERVRQAEPAHGIGSKKADKKSLVVGYSDAVLLKDRTGYTDGNNLTVKAANTEWVKFENNLNPWGLEAVRRTELLRFIAKERQGAYTWSLAEAPNGSVTNPDQWRTLDKEFWTQGQQSTPVRITRPHVKNKGNNGVEILPGLNLYFTAGQNITSGDIQGSSAQALLVFPLEAFAVLGDGPMNLITLPGKFWNFFTMGIGIIKIDVVQGVKDTYQVVNFYYKIEAMKEALRKAKEYAESMRAKFHQHQEELKKAFEARDIVKYNEILNSLKALAADFQNRTGHLFDLTQYIQAGNQLQIFINAQNVPQNPPEPSIPDSSNPPPAPNPPVDEAQPDGPPLTSPEQVEDSGPSNTPSDVLVIPITINEDPIGVNPPPESPTTQLPVDPVVVTSPIDTPQLGSTHNLGNIGHSEQSGPGFDQDDTAFENIPGVDLGITYDTQPPTWYEEGDY